MAKRTLLRLSALAAILAGILRAIASFVPAGRSSINIELLYFSIDLFLLLGLIGFYAVQYEKVGAVGFMGFLLAVIGIITIRSQYAMPSIQLYPLGALTFLAGLNLLTIYSTLAKQLPKWVTAILLLSTVSGFAAFAFQNNPLPFIVSGILFGISFFGIGLYLYSISTTGKMFARASG